MGLSLTPAKAIILYGDLWTIGSLGKCREGIWQAGVGMEKDEHASKRYRHRDAEWPATDERHVIGRPPTSKECERALRKHTGIYLLKPEAGLASAHRQREGHGVLVVSTEGGRSLHIEDKPCSEWRS